MKHFLLAFFLGAAGACGQELGAQTAPTQIQYQGTVLNSSGAPLELGSTAIHKMAFRIWDSASAGTLIWSEEQLVTVSDGKFSVNLGDGSAIGVEPNDLSVVFNARSRFLGITLGSSTNEITPRLAFLSTAYAFVANSVTRVSQQPGTASRLRMESVGYDVRQVVSEVEVALTLDRRSNLIAAGLRGTVAKLPVSGELKELLVVKTDYSDKVVAIAPPSNGSINGVKEEFLRLKAQGDSVTLQNIGGEDWWIVKDTRDKTPVGTIISYGATAPPPGYMACDGSSLLRDEHPDLFAVIGTRWGAASVSDPNVVDGARFNLPELSGRFLRGIDPATNGEDDSAGDRGKLLAGGGTGRNVGTYQQEEIRAHAHSVNDPGHTHVGSATPNSKWTLGSMSGSHSDDGTTFPALGGGYLSTGTHTLSVSGGSVTVAKEFTGITQTENHAPAGQPGLGNETRPVNAAVRYCIKY